MDTKFKLIFEDATPDIDLQKFQQSLPQHFDVTQESDGIYVSIPSQDPEDRRCQYLIDRELDRHYFLTFVKVKAEMVRKRLHVVSRTAYGGHGTLPENILPQVWDNKLSIQLRLWSLAAYAEDHTLKALLLFQIIELAYPDRSDYPKYDPPSPIDPLTVCKFIRHLAAHTGKVKNDGLKKYCKQIGIPERMFDPINPDHGRILRQKIPLLEAQAKRVISNCISLAAPAGGAGP